MPNTHYIEPLIAYDAKYEKAFQQVFGKYACAGSLRWLRHTSTLDGENVDRKGALTRGYHNFHRSRIKAIKGVTACHAKYDSSKTKAQEDQFKQQKTTDQ